MLSLRGNLMKDKMFAWSESISPQITYYKGKKIKFLGRNQTALWLSDQNSYCQGGAHRLHILSAVTPRDENITSVVFWMIMHKVN